MRQPQSARPFRNGPAVQPGQRINNLHRSKSSRAPQRHQTGPIQGGGTTDTESMSAARLAAEAAFAAPQYQPPPTAQAQITVRRMRPRDLPSVVAASDSTAAAESQTKGPRVFRLTAAKPSPLVGVQPNPSTSKQASVVDRDGDKLRPHSRPRRQAAYKKPGPVLHVVHTLPARPEPQDKVPHFDSLAAQVQHIGVLLETAKRASKFRIVETSSTQEWQRLAKIASDIRREIKTQLR
jgi:hypothetical protein